MREPHKRDEPTTYRDPGPTMLAGGSAPMRQLVYAWEGEVEGLHKKIEKLCAVLKEVRQDIEDYGLDDFESTTHETLAKIDAALKE